MDKNLPVGVIDSGVGGLSVLKVLQQALPHEDFLYIGDTARTPYGQRPEKEIRAMVAHLVRCAQTDKENKGVSVSADVNPLD